MHPLRQTRLCGFAPEGCPFHLDGVLHDACGNGPGRGIFMSLVAAPVTVVVDEADFDEDGGHHGAAQDEEPRPFFETPVREVQDGFQIGLDTVPEHQTSRRARDQRLRPAGPAIESVKMKGNKEVAIFAVGLVTDGIEIVVLSKAYGNAVIFEIGYDEAGQFIGCVTFPEVKARIDSARIKQPVVAGVHIDFHNAPFLKLTSRSDFYTGRLAADGNALNGFLFIRTRTGVGPSAFGIRPDGKQDGAGPLQDEDEFPLVEVS